MICKKNVLFSCEPQKAQWNPIHCHLSTSESVVHAPDSIFRCLSMTYKKNLTSTFYDTNRFKFYIRKWSFSRREARLFLSAAEHLSLSPRLCVVDWNRIFLWSCLYSFVIALCLAEQSQCSIKHWHIHLSHSLWSDRKPKEDTHTHTHAHTLRCDFRKCVPAYVVIAFWCQNRTKCIFTCIVWTWTCQWTVERAIDENAVWHLEMENKMFQTEIDQRNVDILCFVWLMESTK